MISLFTVFYVLEELVERVREVRFRALGTSL